MSPLLAKHYGVNGKRKETYFWKLGHISNPVAVQEAILLWQSVAYVLYERMLRVKNPYGSVDNLANSSFEL